MLKLKKIHILGFKSFCDRTELSVPEQALPGGGTKRLRKSNIWTG